MNAREDRKRVRLDWLAKRLNKENIPTEELTSTMIVNFAISRRTALEEINAVKFFMEEKKHDA